MSKLSLVLGASPKEERFSFKAAVKLLENGHPVFLVGRSEGKINGEPIHAQMPDSLDDLDTVTMYLAPENQSAYLAPIKRLMPKRVIFNPGTENPDLSKELVDSGIEVVEKCTLIALDQGVY